MRGENRGVRMIGVKTYVLMVTSRKIVMPILAPAWLGLAEGETDGGTKL